MDIKLYLLQKYRNIYNPHKYLHNNNSYHYNGFGNPKQCICSNYQVHSHSSSNGWDSSTRGRDSSSVIESVYSKRRSDDLHNSPTSTPPAGK